MKRYPAALLAVLLAAALTAGCAAPDNTSGNSPAPGEASAQSPALSAGMAELTSADTDASWDSASATIVTLEGITAAIEGEGARISDGTLTITAGGTYLLSGRFTGSVVVTAPSTATVQLVLDGVDLVADKNAAIHCTQADQLILTLAPGSVNTVADAADFAYSDAAAQEPDAAIFSKDDLTINGTGRLVVTASYHNGIGTKDDLIIAGGALEITAANHGIRGRDSLTVLDGSLAIVSGADGLQANNDEDADKGWISLEGGSYDIQSGNDAIQAETTLSVSGGSYSLAAGGGSTTTPADTTGSYKGLKAGTGIILSGGDFVVDSADDALHSNGDIAISGGTLTLSSGDDGIHADGDLTVTDGEINILASYEGLEASTMTLAGGDISLMATDDGINVAGGNDSVGESRFGGDSFRAGANSDRWLKITGGTIHVNAGGDGIDVNGNAEMSGGGVYVSGPTNSGNGALDYDGSFDVSGGILMAASSAGMAQSLSASSPQASIMLYYSGVQEAGTLVELKDAVGNLLAAYAPENRFQTVVITAPGLEDGSACVLYTGGEKTLDITLSGTVTSLSDTGEAVAGGMGMGRPGGGGMGMGNPGGNRPEGGAPGSGMGMGDPGSRPERGAPGGQPPTG